MGARADYVNTTEGPGDAKVGRDRGAEAQSDPTVLARDIEQTREEMTGTIDAIQERLEPERLSAEAKEVAHYVIEEAKGAVRELGEQASAAIHDATIGRVERMTATTREGAMVMKNDIFSTIKANPIPAALAAVGIGWLWSSRANTSHYQGGMYGSRASQATGYGSAYYDAYGVSGTQGQGTGQQAQQMVGQAASQVQERAGQVQQQLGDTAGQVQNMVGDTAGQIQHRLGDTAGQVQHRIGDTAGQVQRQAQGFWQMLESNPVAAGALGLGIGAIAGMAIPETEKEHQLMGETRDRVISNVQEMAGDTVTKVQIVAEEAGKSAMDAGQAAMEEMNSQQPSGDASKKSGSQSGASSST